MAYAPSTMCSNASRLPRKAMVLWNLRGHVTSYVHARGGLGRDVPKHVADWLHRGQLLILNRGHPCK